MTVNYKETYNIFAVSGILFNHESPLRGKEFVTRKISDNVAKIKLGLIDKFDLGNLNAKRDWGYAKEYVEAIFLMLQQKEPENYVISTGASETVRKFTEYAFESAGINIAWQGKGNEEKGIDVHTGNIKIEVNPDYFRPNEIDYLLGDSRLAKNKLGWSPRTNLKQLAEMMVEKDLQRNKNGTFC